MTLYISFSLSLSLSLSCIRNCFTVSVTIVCRCKKILTHLQQGRQLGKPLRPKDFGNLSPAALFELKLKKFQKVINFQKVFSLFLKISAWSFLKSYRKHFAYIPLFQKDLPVLYHEVIVSEGKFRKRSQSLKIRVKMWKNLWKDNHLSTKKQTMIYSPSVHDHNTFKFAASAADRNPSGGAPSVMR